MACLSHKHMSRKVLLENARRRKQTAEERQLKEGAIAATQEAHEEVPRSKKKANRASRWQAIFMSTAEREEVAKATKSLSK